MSSAPFRVLSLDGGGMRGTYTATYLERVAAAFGIQRNIGSLDIGAGFDLIVGTSTGGIIACALAVAVPLRDIVALYAEHGAAIFERPIPSGVTGVVFDELHRAVALSRGTAALRTALEKRLGQKTLGQVYAERGIRLAIPAVEMSQHRGWVFKTPHLVGTNHRDDNTTLTDVCLATSAAPIYRSLAVVNHPNGSGDGYNVFADGGLWSNNPVLVGLVDALDAAMPDQPIEIFCLGTCPMPSGEQISRSAANRTLTSWKFGGDAASLSIDAQQFALDHMAKKLARHVDRPCSVVRFPSDKVPAALIPYLGLDDTRPEAVQALINQARTDADMTNSKCAYSETDPEAKLICDLFRSLPERTQPLFSRWSLTRASGYSPQAREVPNA